MIQQTPLENSVQAIGVDPTDASNQSKADPIGLRQAYIKCLDVTGGLSPKSKECMNIEYDYQDKRLNNAYMALMKVLNKSEQDKVRSNERIWISYRDSHCEPDPDSGEAQRIGAFECSVEETAKQASALEARLFRESLKQ